MVKMGWSEQWGFGSVTERMDWKITKKKQSLAAEWCLNARRVFIFFFKRPNHLNTQKLLFSWGPGSAGEQMAEGTGIKMDRGHYLMLQVGIWNLQQSSIRWNTTRAPVSSPMTVDSSYDTIEDTTWDQWAGSTSPHLTNSHNPTLAPLSAPPLVFPHRYEA